MAVRDAIKITLDSRNFVVQGKVVVSPLSIESKDGNSRVVFGLDTEGGIRFGRLAPHPLIPGACVSQRLSFDWKWCPVVQMDRGDET